MSESKEDIKVVILCGGKGTRMSEMSEKLPKPLAPIGGKPLVWHIMKNYYAQGYRHFVLCLGYKGKLIREFFLNYPYHLPDITIDVKNQSIVQHGTEELEDWKITLADTGEETLTAQRLQKVKPYLEDQDYFLLTYGDGLSDIDLDKLIEFHKSKGKPVTITGVKTHSKYGQVKTNQDGLVQSFVEKPFLDDIVNGGFMVMNKEFLDHPLLNQDIPLEEVLKDLAEKGSLALYNHDSFWYAMDTIRDHDEFKSIWRSGNVPWKNWEKTRVLLTGNQGYIGSVMEEVLLDNGFEVRGLDAGYFEGGSLVPLPNSVVKNREKNQIIKDIRDVEPSDLANIDAIVHLAALSNDPLGDLDPKLTHEINYLATAKIAELAKKAGVKRFIYSSSCSMYGAADVSKPLDETAEFNPVSAYAQSKVDSETALNKLADENFSPVYMRNATVFGLSKKMRFDLVVNNLSGWAHTISEVKMMSDGKPWRPMVHVRDLCQAFTKALKAPKHLVHNQAFNVGANSENFTIREIAEKVVSGVPNSKLVCMNQVTNDDRSYKVNFDKIKKIGFEAQWSVDRGVSELKQAFEEINLNSETFENEYFTTLKRMKNLLDKGEISPDLRVKKQYKWQVNT